MTEVKPIPRIVEDETILEKIQRYYIEGEGRVIFSSAEAEIHTRLVESYKLLIEHKNKPEASRMIMEAFDVDRSTAYRYLKESEIVFCKTNKLEKETIREIINNMLIEAFKLAKKKKNEKEISRIALAMIKNNSTDKDDSELPWKNWKPNLYYLMIQTKDAPVSINLDKAHQLPTEEIERILTSFDNTIEPEFEILDDE